MRTSRVLLPLLLALPLSAPPASAQESPPAGIWIADASGQLRRVPPGPGIRASRARQAAPAPAGVRVVLAVESFAHSATGALAANRLAAARVVAATSSLAGAAAAPGARAPFVEALYERPLPLTASWEPRRRAGFRAVTRLVLEARDPHRLGLLLDSAMGAGATYVVDVEPAVSPGARR